MGYRVAWGVWAMAGERGLAQPQDPMTIGRTSERRSSVALVGVHRGGAGSRGPFKDGVRQAHGRTCWERDCDETTSWSTPVGVAVDGPAVVTNAGNLIPRTRGDGDLVLADDAE